ncbi:MAG: tRNA (adenosine(37)-N6)-threonylcarbamoyltransferase complex ATPase subunit type 1 TsaE [Acidimicrobiales bacterium]
MIKAATTSVEETRALAAGVATLAAPGDLIVLAGDLGTGKTAFAQGFARGLGVEEAVTSPAFILVRTYRGRLPLVHLDVYRLDTMQELVDLGIAELLDDGAVTLIEWGDAVAPGLPANFLEVRLEARGGPDDRLVSIRTVGPGWPPRARALEAAVAKWAVQGC